MVRQDARYLAGRVLPQRLERFQKACSGRALYRPWTSTSGAGPGRYMKCDTDLTHDKPRDLALLGQADALAIVVANIGLIPISFVSFRHR